MGASRISFHFPFSGGVLSPLSLDTYSGLTLFCLQQSLTVDPRSKPDGSFWSAQLFVFPEVTNFLGFIFGLFVCFSLNTNINKKLWQFQSSLKMSTPVRCPINFLSWRNLCWSLGPQGPATGLLSLLFGHLAPARPPLLLVTPVYPLLVTLFVWRNTCYMVSWESGHGRQKFRRLYVSENISIPLD